MKPSLLILAAGVGSRYGGLKQLDPVGPSGAALMDYTIHDAIAAGFTRVVLVIRRETEAEFRKHMDRGAARTVEVAYVHQELDMLPLGFVPQPDRIKPWGTGHAVLTASKLLDRPFVVANADDYYGRKAITALGTYLADPADEGPALWAMVGYRLADTLPRSGSVSRALCRQDSQGWLTELQEILSVERVGGVARWRDTDSVQHIEPLETLVSMNLWGFTPDLLSHLERGFRTFLKAKPGLKDEYYLPVAVGEAVADRTARVKVLPEGGRWCGMTSPEDRAATAAVLKDLVDGGVYPAQLWE